jgi:hypothetical protein
MARTLGVPARVAVGFTQGEQQDDGSYLVLGRNAHAWPEVWFDDYGWVPFEPTPGRGMPGVESFTGVAPQQDGEPPPTTSTATAPTGPTTTVAGQAPPPSPQGATTTTIANPTRLRDRWLDDARRGDRQHERALLGRIGGRDHLPPRHAHQRDRGRTGPQRLGRGRSRQRQRWLCTGSLATDGVRRHHGLPLAELITILDGP